MTYDIYAIKDGKEILIDVIEADTQEQAIYEINQIKRMHHFWNQYSKKVKADIDTLTLIAKEHGM